MALYVYGFTAFCSCCTETNLIPAGSKMSRASMKADPTIPKMCFVSWATRVSTKASLEVIFVTSVLHLGSPASDLLKIKKRGTYLQRNYKNFHFFLRNFYGVCMKHRILP